VVAKLEIAFISASEKPENNAMLVNDTLQLPVFYTIEIGENQLKTYTVLSITPLKTDQVSTFNFHPAPKPLSDFT